MSTNTLSGAAQPLDDGLRQVLVDLVMPRHRLGLPGVGIGIPIVTRAVAHQSAAQRFESLDQFAPVHSRDQEFFHLADVRHFARLDVNQKVFQVFSQFALGRSLGLIVRIVIQEADVELPVAPKCEAHFLHEDTLYQIRGQSIACEIS